ncbi:MAG: hypothetical protein ACPGWM_06595 [Flavobacteriales bacterium]
MRISGMLLILLFCSSLISFGQTLKQLDHSYHYKLSGVHTQKVMLEHENGPQCLEFERKFDEQGRLIEETRYFACGRVHSIQKFNYNEEGKLTRNTFSQVFMQFEEIEFDLLFNEHGQLIERSLNVPIPQGWQKETIGYHPDGSIKTCKQWIQNGEQWEVFTEQEFDTKQADQAARKKNSLSKVYDMNGLPLVHYRYTETGEIKSALRYTYLSNEDLGSK